MQIVNINFCLCKRILLSLSNEFWITNTVKHTEIWTFSISSFSLRTGNLIHTDHIITYCHHSVNISTLIHIFKSPFVRPIVSVSSLHTYTSLHITLIHMFKKSALTRYFLLFFCLDLKMCTIFFALWHASLPLELKNPQVSYKYWLETKAG